MLVGEGAALNILLANNNKVLNNVLKEADSKLFETIVKQDPKLQTTAKEVINELFANLKDGSKSTTTIENILKNSTIFKELGNVSSNLLNLKNVLQEFDTNNNLSKFKPLIENLSKNIKDLDLKNLKEQIKNSGVFLENKLVNTQNIKIENILKDIQNLLKTTQIPITKQVNEQITKILQDIQNPKSLINQNLQNTKNMQNQNENLEIKKFSISSNQAQIIQKELKQITTPSAQTNSQVETTQNYTPNIKVNSQLKSDIQNSQTSLQTNSQVNVQNIIQKDLILNNPLANNLKTLTQNLQILSENLNTKEFENLTNHIKELKNAINQASLVESKFENNTTTKTAQIFQNQNPIQNISTQTPQEIVVKEQITNETKQLLIQIKDEVLKNPTLVQNKNILQIIDTLLKMENLFIKNDFLQNMADLKQLNQVLTQNNISTFSNNFASNLSPLLTALKENLNNLSNPNILNIQNHLAKTINKVEHIISNLETQIDEKVSPKDDMKAILLQLKEELSAKTDAKSAEILKQVDKILTQIDFYQLNSLITNSNYVYVPFFWEMLEDGSINIRKAENDKFYCQINLSLKDFGKVDLMLGLYDKNKMDLTIYAQRDHFKTAIRENIKDLKLALNSVNIIPVNIKLLDMKENIEDTPTSSYINNTFNQNINSGIDIKV